MSRLVFGVDREPAGAAVRMAYIARRQSCGHIVIAQADSRKDSLQEFIGLGLAGLLVERIPSELVRAEGFCTCPKPTQQELPL